MLAINWGHMVIYYIPVSYLKMVTEVLNMIIVAGLHDKRQLTAILEASLAGAFLLPQIINAGKTPCCVSSTKLPEDWNVTFIEN